MATQRFYDGQPGPEIRRELNNLGAILDGTVASAASTAATSASAKAQQWADAAPGVEVETGKYSAKHWADRAQTTVTGGLIYRGSHSAASGEYPATPSLGYYYKISAAGTLGGVDYSVGDSIIYNGTGWDKIDSTDAVISVAGRVGAVVLTKGDVGLGNVDNTSDANKPVSIATQTALDGKANTTHTHAIAELRDQDIDDHADGNTIPARLGNPLANFYSPALTPTASVVLDPDSAADYLKLQGTDDPWRYARNIWEIKKFGRKLFFGSGSSSNGGPAVNAGTTFGGVPVITYDLDSKAWAVEAVLPEEQIDRYVEIGGTLVVPGHDSMQDWTLGSRFTRQSNGTWIETRDIPDGVHVYDMIEHSGVTFAALGTATGGRISHFDSATSAWVTDIDADSRFYRFLTVGGVLYAERGWPAENETTFTTPYFYRVSVSGGVVTVTGLPLLVSDVYPDTQVSVTSRERVGRAISVDDKCVYIGAHAFNDHSFRAYGAYVASPRGNGLSFYRMDIPFEADPFDVLATDDHVYLLSNRERYALETSDRNIVSVYRTRRDLLGSGSVWEVALSFRCDGLARSFAEADGYLYVGIGSEPGSTGVSAATQRQQITADTGCVYRFKVPGRYLTDVQLDSTYLSRRDDSLRRLKPPALDANFTQGALPSGVTFARASSAGYLDNASNHAVVASGTPRFEVDLLGGARGIQIEGASSNMARRSDELSNTTRWTVSGLQPVVAATVDGDSWFELIEDASTGRHRMVHSISVPVGGLHTWSFDALPGAGITRLSTWFSISGATTRETFYDLMTGVSTGVSFGPLPTGVTAKALPLIGGGFRIVYTADATNITSVQINAYRGSSSYTGDGTSRLYIRKPLFEPGALDGSYIPTVDATATRVAEALTAAPSALTVARGTLAWCGEVHGGDPTLIQADAGSDASCIRAHISGGRVLAYCGSSAVIDLGSVPSGAFVVAMSWSLADGLFYAAIDGAVKSLDLTAADMPAALTTIRIGGRVGGAVGRQYIRSAKHWGRALPLENITARGLQ